MKIRWISGLKKRNNIYVNVAIKDENIKETEDLHQHIDNNLGQRTKRSSSTFIKTIFNSYTLNKTEVININNVSSHDNLTVTIPYKQESMLRNNVNNDNMADEYEIKTSKPNSKIENAPTTSNNLDNEKIDHAFKLQNEKHVSKYIETNIQ